MSIVSSRIGRPRPLVDGLEKVSGTAVYTHDFKLDGMLHAAVLRSPWPHAQILGVDVTAARKRQAFRRWSPDSTTWSALPELRAGVCRPLPAGPRPRAFCG